MLVNIEMDDCSLVIGEFTTEEKILRDILGNMSFIMDDHPNWLDKLKKRRAKKHAKALAKYLLKQRVYEPLTAV